MWQDIHPNISRVSKDLFCDGHFAAAAEIAIKEIETQMRTIFKQYNPTAFVPKDAPIKLAASLGTKAVGLAHYFQTRDCSNSVTPQI